MSYIDTCYIFLYPRKGLLKIASLIAMFYLIFKKNLDLRGFKHFRYLLLDARYAKMAYTFRYIGSSKSVC